MTPEEIAHQKDVEYYASSVNAWFNTSLEHDKSILTLAAGGLGLFITLLTTVGLSSSEALILLRWCNNKFSCGTCFGIGCFSTEQNVYRQYWRGKLLETTLYSLRPTQFAYGLLKLVYFLPQFIGIATAIHSYTLKEKTMATEPPKSTGSVPLHESFNGASNLSISNDSFNGVASLQKVLMVRPISDLSLLQALPFLPPVPLHLPHQALRKTRVAIQVISEPSIKGNRR